MANVNTTSEIGKVYGRWRVISFDRYDGKHHYLLCRCRCGIERIVTRNNLRKGASRSCGCLALEVHTKHGECKSGNSKTYGCWLGLFARCRNPRHPSFENYGARGITVCERWKTFANFLADMGRKPPGLTIERIDNEKGYSPENCRWATHGEQNRNMRSNTFFTHDGVSMILVDWARRKGMNITTLRYRVWKLGWTMERAVTTPVGPRGRRFKTARA